MNRIEFKYVARYALPDAGSIGMGPTISIDWEVKSENRYTIPDGLGVTKTARFGSTPVKFRLEAHYCVIRPEDLGTEWKILFRITPVSSSPFQRKRGSTLRPVRPGVRKDGHSPGGY